MNIPNPTVKLFGFCFSTAKSVVQVADEIMQETAVSGTRHLITPNASTIVYYSEKKHNSVKAFYKNARFILADGMPVVWLAKLKSKSLHRLTGSDLFPELWKRVKAARINAVFVVANENLAQKLKTEHPGCQFIIPRMFEQDEELYIEEIAVKVAAAVQEINAQFVFLGLNFPKQEKLGIQITAQADAPAPASLLILLLGASYEFYFSQKPRAPQWMQRNGLEWLHRFSQEPRRLWKRYTIDNIRFLLIAIKELFAPAE